MPNNTNRTRISIDFRVLSDASGGHDPDFRKGVKRGGKAQFEKAFDIGGYYSVMETPADYSLIP